MFVIINGILISDYIFVHKKSSMFNFQRGMHFLKSIKSLSQEQDIYEEANNHSFTKAKIAHDIVKTKGKILFDEKIIQGYVYNNSKYFLFTIPKDIEKRGAPIEKDIALVQYFLEDLSLYPDLIKTIKNYGLVFIFLIDFILILFYIFLYKKLKPIKKLHQEVIKFSEGNLDISLKVKGKDEISNVSNEFLNAVKKIKELNHSRTLFLRNILHELRTPMAKISLISSTLENSRRKEILEKSSLRLNSLINEFTKLEELNSGSVTLHRNQFRVLDLLDEAIDILLFDKDKINIDSEDVILNVDFDFFSICLKNFIHNCIKYTSKNDEVKIKITQDYILFSNKGVPLNHNINTYFDNPFTRDYQNTTQSLGLGLYISNQIINLHGFNLTYEYKDNFHLFKIITK